MTEQEILFLFTVRDTCKANPEMVAKIVDAANTGLRDRFDEMRELSANIEAVAANALENIASTSSSTRIRRVANDALTAIRARRKACCEKS